MYCSLWLDALCHGSLSDTHLEEAAQAESLPEPQQARAPAPGRVLISIPGLPRIIATSTISVTAPTAIASVTYIIILWATPGAGAPSPPCPREAVRGGQHPPGVHKVGGPAPTCAWSCMHSRYVSRTMCPAWPVHGTE